MAAFGVTVQHLSMPILSGNRQLTRRDVLGGAAALGLVAGVPGWPAPPRRAGQLT